MTHNFWDKKNKAPGKNGLDLNKPSISVERALFQSLFITAASIVDDRKTTVMDYSRLSMSTIPRDSYDEHDPYADLVPQTLG
jgi:hypothetical protein